MAQKRTDSSKVDQLIAESRRKQKQQENAYRERALKIYPHICGRCGREFSGKRLKELTVHHRDHNHDNNPPDGSNWELLCIYCHDNEHSRDSVAEWYDDAEPETGRDLPADKHNPFAGLADMLRAKNQSSK
ncbi:MAG: YajD family HNH nuclease [Desulfobacterales bacterium]